MKKKIMLGTSDAWSVVSPMDPASQRIILKIVGFLNTKLSCSMRDVSPVSKEDNAFVKVCFYLQSTLE